MPKTVEGAQCFLEHLGWVLMPLENGKPPVRIHDYTVEALTPVVFSKPNTKSRRYWYKRSEVSKAWDITYEEASSS